MVQKYQSPVRVYKYPFELVMAAYEMRFPSCEMIPVFVGSDLISEENSQDGSSQVIERRCKLNVEAPYLLKKISGVEYFYCIQRNSLDRRTRTLKIEAWNESFANRIVINEYCTYSVHPDNSSWTCFEQSASLEVKSFFGFETAVEKLAAKHYAASIKKGKEIIEHFVNELKNQNITYIAPFVDAAGALPEKTACEDSVSVEAEEEALSSSSGSASSVEGIDSISDCFCLRDKQDEGKSFSNNIHESDTANNKLHIVETKYEGRCMCTLTVYEKSSMVQFKTWLSDAHPGSIPPDPTLLRFLLTQEFNLEKARETLCQSMAWRKQFQAERIRSTAGQANLEIRKTS